MFENTGCELGVGQDNVGLSYEKVSFHLTTAERRDVLVVPSSSQSMGYRYILFSTPVFFLAKLDSTNSPCARSLSGKWQ